MDQRDVLHSLERLVAEIDVVWKDFDAKSRRDATDYSHGGEVATSRIRESAAMLACRRVLERAEIER